MKKNLYSIPAYLPFADTLAQWIVERHGADPLALPHLLVLLPSRRAQLALREAFLRITGGTPTLLPRMQPLGEVDEDRLLTLPGIADTGQLPHPASASKRLFLLARLVRVYQSNVQGKNERMDHAVRQARDIATLLDKVEREGASLDNLATLAPETFAAHWQLTTEFLTIVAEHWPAIARERNLTSPEHWRNQSLLALAQAWKQSPPEHPVIAAGTTGSIASTAALLKVIAELPQGAVVLPGLDKQAGKDYMEHVSESHPQWGMRQLLAGLDADREDVVELGTRNALGEARTALLSRALAPAQMLTQWRTDADATQAVRGFAIAPCADQQEEATVIALALREVIETPAKTAALVTHDRALARRVAAEMLRFQVQIDDSAGRALSETPAAAFMRLVLEVAESQASPVAVLALLKHPFAHLGMERIACLEATRELERDVLRGICPAYGLEGLRAEAQRSPSEAVQLLLKELEERMNPLLAVFAQGGNEEFSVLLKAHIACAEALAGDMLWRGREAETLVALIDELHDAADEAGMIELASYPALFGTLLIGKVVRPEYGIHPRLKILSPIEARMQSFDRIILGGLNEGSWPPQVGTDPWFNRTMRAAMGLAMPEQQTGQAAHDFTMLASAPEVFLTRAEKVEGSPVSPARWWVRLMALLTHYGVSEQVQPACYTQWARALDSEGEAIPCMRPAPSPPLAARPVTIAVTQVERWLSDPYAFYAANMLKLRKLDAINQDPSAADFGNMVHAALQHFTEDYPRNLPSDAIDYLLHHGNKMLDAYRFYPVAKAWWWPRFEQIAEWMIGREKALRPDLTHVWAEVKGSFELEGMIFTGRADRIEQTCQGSLAIVDYKTGGAHSKYDTRAGNAVQLMLLALIAQEGRWDRQGIESRKVTRLEYWIAGGGRHSGEIRPVEEAQIAEYAAEAKSRLIALIEEYRNPTKTYSCAVTTGRYNDYGHLARMQEWR